MPRCPGNRTRLLILWSLLSVPFSDKYPVSPISSQQALFHWCHLFSGLGAMLGQEQVGMEHSAETSAPDPALCWAQMLTHG